jgi:osmotically-inducible protein OsmY
VGSAGTRTRRHRRGRHRRGGDADRPHRHLRQKLAAVRAAERVEGVKAVANEIKVELAGMGRDDADIGAAIACILDWDVQIPEGAVHARVENGWVILAGEVG